MVILRYSLCKDYSYSVVAYNFSTKDKNTIVY